MDPMTMMALSAGLSALGSGLSAWGNKRQARTTPSIPSDMLQRQNKLWGMGMEGMQNPSAGFEPIAQQARQRFYSQTVPSLAERFTSMGNGQRSSAFQGALGRAGAGLEGDLAAQSSQYGLQRMGQLQNLLGMGMGSQGDYLYEPEQMGGLQQFGATLGSAAVPMLSKSYDAYNAQKVSGSSEEIIDLLKELLGGA